MSSSNINAGIFGPAKRRITADGIEETFAVNHLAPFILTQELMDVLKATPPSRIVNVASSVHAKGQMHWEDLGLTKDYGQFKAYQQSKLANVLFTYELAHQLEGSGTTANCLQTPGTVATDFGKKEGGMAALTMRMARPFLLTPKEEAETVIYLASSPEVEGVNGQYFDKCRPVKSSSETYNRTSQEKLWHISEEMIKGSKLQTRIASFGSDDSKEAHELETQHTKKKLTETANAPLPKCVEIKALCKDTLRNRQVVPEQRLYTFGNKLDGKSKYIIRLERIMWNTEWPHQGLFAAV